MLVFDIETEPADMETIQRIVPAFDGQSIPHPGEFDATSVKLGNLKDKAKIDEKIEAARKAHEQAVASHAEKVAAAEADYWKQVNEAATLDAAIGKVCAIGYRNHNGIEILHLRTQHDEIEMLGEFWRVASTIRHQGRKMIGFYSNMFDVPFLARRSWINGVSVPDWITTPTGFLSPVFVDLIQIWQSGNRRDSIKLDKLARALGIEGKPDDCDGATFWRMLRGGEEEREVAISYLRGDLRMTAEVATRLGVM
jgi:hypothetical protein